MAGRSKGKKLASSSYEQQARAKENPEGNRRERRAAKKAGKQPPQAKVQPRFGPGVKRPTDESKGG